MSEMMDLKTLQREAHKVYNSDGVLDISVGLSLVLCAVLIYAGLPWLSFVALAAGVSTYYALKRVFTMPRTGYAKFRVLEGDRSLLNAAIIAFVALTVILMMALLAKDMLLTLAAVAAAMLVLTGYVFYIERLYAYALVVIGTCVAGRVFGLENVLAATLPQDIVHILYIIIPGAVMMVAGAFLLAFYAGKYEKLAACEPVMET